MPKLRLITSSTQRRLISALADTIRTQPLSPLETECIAVLSPGMARWISMELASRLGVSAGVDFCFPNDLLDRCFKAVLPKTELSSPYTRTAMTWRIASQLPSLASMPGFEPVANYLGDGRDERHLLQLSGSVANYFDQYIIFRPEMIQAWDHGNEDHWQAQLWRAITVNSPGNHRAALLSTLRAHASRHLPFTNTLPRRISLFGISYLPPFHLDALQVLSTYCEITCYLLNPCGQYWGTIISAKKISQLALTTGLPEEAKEYYETGNPLLSSLGTVGQEFFETLLEAGFEQEELDDSPHTPFLDTNNSCTSLLSAIQHDILDLYDRSATASKGIVSVSDRSLQIHSCHGPLREMEILYDNLLAMFDELPDLEPRQIAVMIPDIEKYAPYISSVFGARTTGRPSLPYTIADRSIRRENRFVDAAMQIFELAANRFSLHDMLNFLELPFVLKRFGIDDNDFEAIKIWLVDCNIRWGVDAGHRVSLGFPHYSEFSWQDGLDRLFLGYAMVPDDVSTFCGIFPHTACSGRQAEALGKLAQFIAATRETSVRLNGHYTLTEWVKVLKASIDQLLEADECDPAGPHFIAKIFTSLHEASSLYGFVQPIGLNAIRDYIAEQMNKNGNSYEFMNGAITFCAMLPMRNIPMRIIWLAGMNDGQFPRIEREPGFNLMHGARRRGDHSLRDEDRYLFLEALMAAEDRLCISFTGHSDRDNCALPPSVLVAELIDYIAQGFVQSDGTSPVSVLVKHRLQGFSPLYFSGSTQSHLFSYDRETWQALVVRRDTGLSRHEFLCEPFPLDASPLVIDLPQLARFLSNPAAVFLDQRLGIKPFSPTDTADDSEPFTLDALSRYNLAQELVSWVLKGAEYEECLSNARARGILPPLSAGKAFFDEAWEKSRLFAVELSKQISTPLEPLTVNFVHKRVQLHAVLKNTQRGRHLRWRCTGMKGKDRLAIWLDHLVLNVALADGYPLQSTLIASDTILELPPLEHAADILTNLLDLYCDGMMQPLRFFSETSWLYLNEGQARAENSWRGDQQSGIPGESGHQAISLCFGDEPPWGEEFSTLATQIYGPLINAIKK